MSTLTPAAVVQIRERHEFLRQMEDRAGKDLDAQVAAEFAVSQSHVRDIVTGVARADDGGPIDKARAVRRELFRQERESLGDREARRRMNLRSRGIDPEPKAARTVTRVTVVDHRGKDTDMVAYLEPGQTLRVDNVLEGGIR